MEVDLFSYTKTFVHGHTTTFPKESKHVYHTTGTIIPLSQCYPYVHRVFQKQHGREVTDSPEQENSKIIRHLLYNINITLIYPCLR